MVFENKDITVSIEDGECKASFKLNPFLHFSEDKEKRREHLENVFLACIKGLRGINE
jgi:hypothetical protein